MKYTLDEIRAEAERMKTARDAASPSPWTACDGGPPFYHGAYGIMCPFECNTRMLLQLNFNFPFDDDSAFIIAARNSALADMVLKLLADHERLMKYVPPDEETVEVLKIYQRLKQRDAEFSAARSLLAELGWKWNGRTYVQEGDAT